MATPNLLIQNINSLEDQGKALAVSFAVISLVDAKNLKLSMRVDKPKENSTEFRVAIHGFDYKLGQLMLSLKAEGGERIPTQRIRDCHLHKIADQRRSEALWFASNEDDIRAFVKKAKVDYTNLGSIKRAMKPKAPMTLVAPKVETPVEPKVETPTNEVTSTPTVGANPNLKVTPTLVVNKMMDIVKANGLDLEEIIEMLQMEQEIMLLENEVIADPIDEVNKIAA